MPKIILPEPVIINLEESHASVIYKCDFSQATQRKMPNLYVQAIDAYGYQREWTLAFRHEPGDSSKMYWESSAYRHSAVRHVVQVSPQPAERLLVRFLEQVKEYPNLMFNPTSYKDGKLRNARNYGFVHFHEYLLQGADPSVKML